MLEFTLVTPFGVIKMSIKMNQDRELVHLVPVEWRINQILILCQDRLVRALAKYKIASFLRNITFSFVVVLWRYFAVEPTIERPFKSIRIRGEIIKRRQ